MVEGDERGSASQEPLRDRGRRYVLLPAATFLVGLLLGAALVWVTQPDEEDSSGAPPESPGPSASVSSPASSASPGSIVIPGACLRAAEAAEELVGLARDAVSAVGDLDAAALEDVVNRMQTLDERVRADVRECRQPEAP